MSGSSGCVVEVFGSFSGVCDTVSGDFSTFWVLEEGYFQEFKFILIFIWLAFFGVGRIFSEVRYVAR